MKTTTFFRIVTNGETVSIANTRKEAEYYIKNGNFHAVLGDDATATIFEDTQNLLEVNGEVMDFDGYPHVVWNCPFCGHEHATDLEDGETSPALWFCEMGKKDERGINFLLVNFIH